MLSGASAEAVGAGEEVFPLYQGPQFHLGGWPGPDNMETGDFDVDGYAEIRIGDYGYVTLVEGGPGDGGTDLLLCNHPVAATDFDGDGRTDLALGGYFASLPVSSLVVVYGLPEGGWGNPEEYFVGYSPCDIAVADFNADGRTDLAVTDSGSDVVVVLTAQEEGGFGDAETYPTGDNPYVLLTEDFNGDGRPDLAASNQGSDTVTLLYGQADGGFVDGVAYAVALRPYDLAAADFNADGRPDLAVGCDTGLTVLYGLAEGGMGSRVDYAIEGISETGVSTADFNGDGRADLAMMVFGSARIMYGQIGGGFGDEADFPAGGGGAMATGDFDGDGRPDLAVIGGDVQLRSCLTLLYGREASGFSGRSDYTLGGATREHLIAADFNGDGRPDLATAGVSVTVFLGQQGGTLGDPSYYPGGTGDGLAAADFDGDGLLDLAIADSSADVISVLHGQAGGAFEITLEPTTYAVGSSPCEVVSADFNDDDLPDVAVTNSGADSVTVLYGQAEGGLGGREDIAVGASPGDLITTDLNGDGRPDLVIANQGGDDITVLAGQAGGGFARQDYPIDAGPVGVTAGDFDEDGLTDVAVSQAVGEPGYTGVTILYGQQGGGLGERADINLDAWFPSGITASDLNGDGHLDLAMNCGAATVLLGDGAGGFAEPRSYATAGTGDAGPILACDLDGGGLPELVLDSRMAFSLTVLDNLQDSSSPQPAGPTNYALLFSGGGDPGSNHLRYYENIRDLYQTITTQYDVPADNVYLLYADGLGSAVDRSDGANSDMSFAAEAHVLAATRENLDAVLLELTTLVTSQDHFLFWSFDHGGGIEDRPEIQGEEILVAWPREVWDDILASWLQPIQAAHSTYVMAQCFSGGMLDNLEPLESQAFGCAATNHYEPSWSDGFARAFRDALADGYGTTRQAYRYAYLNDPFATDGEGPQGDYDLFVEHPWCTGDDFRIFIADENLAPSLTEIDTLTGLVNTGRLITYANLTAAADAADADGDRVAFVVDSVTSGTLTKHGAPVVAGTTTLGYGETLFWVPPVDATGLLDAFTVTAFDGLEASASPVQVRVDVLASWGDVAHLEVTDNSGCDDDGTTVDDALRFIPTPNGATSGVLAFALANTGSQPLNITDFALGGTHPADFALTVRDVAGDPVDVTGGAFVIPPGETYTVEAQFAPLAAGDRTATLAFESNDSGGVGVPRALTLSSVSLPWNAPTLTAVEPLTGAVENTDFEVTYWDLAAAADETDPDSGTTLGFRVESVLAGTLTGNGEPVTAGQSVLGIGGVLLWTPPADTRGTVEAFTVTAWDGGLSSGDPIAVAIDLWQEHPWHNTALAEDVNDSTTVEPLDALLVINALNAGEGGALAVPPVAPAVPPPFCDVNGDDYLSPLDALRVINCLNNAPAQSATSAALAREISASLSDLARFSRAEFARRLRQGSRGGVFSARRWDEGACGSLLGEGFISQTLAALGALGRPPLRSGPARGPVSIFLYSA